MDEENQEHDIVVEITNEIQSDWICLSRVESLVRVVCRRFGILSATVGVRIVDDAQIIRLNEQFLSCNEVTDCLSFDLSDEMPGSAKIFDIVVNGELADRQGKLRGHSPEAETALYITHGLLHNLGFDDRTQQEAKKMHETEDEILQDEGFGFVYNKDSAPE